MCGTHLPVGWVTELRKMTRSLPSFHPMPFSRKSGQINIWTSWSLFKKNSAIVIWRVGEQPWKKKLEKLVIWFFLPVKDTTTCELCQSSKGKRWTTPSISALYLFFENYNAWHNMWASRPLFERNQITHTCERERLVSAKKHQNFNIHVSAGQ